MHLDCLPRGCRCKPFADVATIMMAAFLLDDEIMYERKIVNFSCRMQFFRDCGGNRADANIILSICITSPAARELRCTKYKSVKEQSRTHASSIHVNLNYYLCDINFRSFVYLIICPDILRT